MGFIKRTAVATVLATAVVAMVGQGGAFGVAGAVALGTGTITPGLSTACTVQTDLTFDSTLLVYASTSGPTISDTGATHFDGASSGCETATFGQGSGILSGELAGAVTYQRIANIMTLDGTINGGVILVAACIFVPTAINPATTYALACVAATR
jgi:hypothetical protein